MLARVICRVMFVAFIGVVMVGTYKGIRWYQDGWRVVFSGERTLVVQEGAEVGLGDEVLVRLPEEAGGVALVRGYVRSRWPQYAPTVPLPLVLTVVAVGGMEVCWRDVGMVVEGEVEALHYSQDRQGRPMMRTGAAQGCKVLEDEVALKGREGFIYDSRYFGAVRRDMVVARVVRAW